MDFPELKEEATYSQSYMQEKVEEGRGSEGVES